MGTAMHIIIKTLQRTFVTNPDHWLGQSLYFEKLLSNEWNDRQEDGSYLIETDADIFEHILRYLRTGVLPIFYDRLVGHNFPLYQALLEESKYFAIDRLEKWLRERKYLDAVKVHYLATESQDRNDYVKSTVCGPDGRTFMVEDRFIEISAGGNTEITITPVTQQRQSFYCPLGEHGIGTENSCRSCVDLATDRENSIYGGWRQADQLKWCVVRKEVVFDHDLCINAYSTG